MSIYTQILSKPLPETIYHYTSQTGFLGIVKNNCVWATKAQYQNDSKEFQHALDLSKQIIDEIEYNATSEEERLLRLMKRTLDSIQNVNTFVCSFSQHKDRLSQWRGYCPSGNGFSLGFDYKILKLIVERQNFNLVPCIYNELEQRQLITEIIIETLQLFRTDLGNSINIKLSLRNRSNEYRIRMYSIAPIIKHSTFAEEREWRAISLPIPFTNPQIEYREGVSMLIPYFIIKFDEENPLKKIVIGPTPHEELSRNSVSSFLHANNVKYYEISHSSIPFRGW